MLQTGDRVQKMNSSLKGTVMGEVRYRRNWYKIVLWDGFSEGQDVLVDYLEKIDAAA